MRNRRSNLYHNSTPTTSPRLVIAWTLLASYFMARGSDPDTSQRGRMLYTMANGVTNLYVLQLLGNTNFSFASDI
jgi:hypothetical protein